MSEASQTVQAASAAGLGSGSTTLCQSARICAVRAQVSRGYADIRDTERNIVTPAMRLIEAQDPERRLVGVDFRRKSRHRVLEKVCAALSEQPDLAPMEALASVKDAIRYTFAYIEDRYTDGVQADKERLVAEGFELVNLRNSWASEDYKGINSWWRVCGNRQLFEVQFHTKISFKAKQLTHGAYERLRNPLTAKAEHDELVNFQRRVNACVPAPAAGNGWRMFRPRTGVVSRGRSGRLVFAR